MTKINKDDLENISVIKNEFKLKNISTIKIKKGDYEIEISSSTITSSPINNSDIKREINSKESLNELKNINKNKDTVKSPMVGVAYLSADPASQPYIKTGQKVKQGDTLLLIEAMKTFNEVKASKSGVIKEIIVLNSQPVEFGDDLLILE